MSDTGKQSMMYIALLLLKKTRNYHVLHVFIALWIYTVMVSPVMLHAERKTFTFSADTTSANLAEGKEFTQLQGNALVTADDVRITADTIQLFGDDFQFAEVNGKFLAIDLKNDFSLEGDKLFYDRQEKLLRAEGNIMMKDNQNDVVIRARFLESKEDGKFMVVQLGVRITKKEELSARSEFLTYYRETEILEMTGFPYALWKDDEYNAERVNINLDTDEVHLEGKVSGSISTVSDDEEKENGEQEKPSDSEGDGEYSEGDGEEFAGEGEGGEESDKDKKDSNPNIKSEQQNGKKSTDNSGKKPDKNTSKSTDKNTNKDDEKQRSTKTDIKEDIKTSNE